MPSQIPTDDIDVLDNLEEIMNTPDSPITAPTVLGKHPRADDNDEDSSSEDEDPVETSQGGATATPAPSTANLNIVTIARQAAANIRLSGDQAAELEEFALASANARAIKSHALLLSVHRQLEKIIVNKAGFEVSRSLQINLNREALIVLLSPNLSCYRGAPATDILMGRLCDGRFDSEIYSGIRDNHADWRVLLAAAQGALTERRSDIKKALRQSLQADSKPPGPWSIVQLNRHLIKKVPTLTINVRVCARLAFLRSVYLKDSSNDFFQTVDNRLADLRAKAKMDEKKIRKVFSKLLDADREKYGKIQPNELRPYDVDEED